jgi:uncharacterized membrane protein
VLVVSDVDEHPTAVNTIMVAQPIATYFFNFLMELPLAQSYIIYNLSLSLSINL